LEAPEIPQAPGEQGTGKGAVPARTVPMTSAEQAPAQSNFLLRSLTHIPLVYFGRMPRNSRYERQLTMGFHL